MNAFQSTPVGRWTIFCKIVDNLGDIGVCWRLARTLALHHGIFVDLRVDHPDCLQKICSRARLVDGKAVVDGVTVGPWSDGRGDAEASDVVIEAFGCELPEDVVLGMATQERPPVWVNLEYLSAEAWVEDYHLMRSPHPRLPLIKVFFFPGYSPATGGLLREPDLFAARDAFRSEAGARARFLRELGCGEVGEEVSVISLFSYENEALPQLLDTWAAGQAVLVLVPEGRILDQVTRYFAVTEALSGACFTRGALTLRVLPFVDQSDYDRLLWMCDVNFVRGEDSFVRAQWAGRPFVWHAYPQEDGAHFSKIDAFLARYTAGLNSNRATAVSSMWHAWNCKQGLGARWAAFSAALPALRDHAEDWADELGRQDDLATALVKFVNEVV